MVTLPYIELAGSNQKVVFLEEASTYIYIIYIYIYICLHTERERERERERGRERGFEYKVDKMVKRDEETVRERRGKKDTEGRKYNLKDREE